jgi:hypothetical protein
MLDAFLGECLRWPAGTPCFRIYTMARLEKHWRTIESA